MDEALLKAILTAGALAGVLARPRDPSQPPPDGRLLALQARGYADAAMKVLRESPELWREAAGHLGEERQFVVVSVMDYEKPVVRKRLDTYDFAVGREPGTMAAPTHPRLQYFLERVGVPFRVLDWTALAGEAPVAAQEAPNVGVS